MRITKPIDQQTMEEIKNSIGDRSIRQAAEDIGISVASLSKILSRKMNPSPEMVARIVRDDITKTNPDYEKSIQSFAQNDMVMKRGVKEYERYERTVLGALALHLLNESYEIVAFMDCKNRDAFDGRFILRKQNKIEDRFFEIRRYTGRQLRYEHERRVIHRILKFRCEESQKVSVIVNTETAYKWMKQEFDEISYKGNLSVMLFNEETLSFLEADLTRS